MSEVGAEVVETAIPVGGGRTMAGVMAIPAGEGPHPGVVVVSDVFGLTAQVRRVVARLAGEGYAAIAHDLYGRPPRVACVVRVLADLAAGTSEASVNDVAAAAAHLGDQPGVDGSRMAAVGFCVGGGFALAFAARGRLRAVAVNYGAAPRDLRELAGVCPVVASYGALDPVFTEQGRRLEATLRGLGVPHDVKVYDGVGHSFMEDHTSGAASVLIRLPSPLRPGYDAEAAEDAWARILSFFAEHV